MQQGLLTIFTILQLRIKFEMTIFKHVRLFLSPSLFLASILEIFQLQRRFDVNLLCYQGYFLNILLQLTLREKYLVFVTIITW